MLQLRVLIRKNQCVARRNWGGQKTPPLPRWKPVSGGEPEGSNLIWAHLLLRQCNDRFDSVLISQKDARLPRWKPVSGGEVEGAKDPSTSPDCRRCFCEIRNPRFALRCTRALNVAVDLIDCMDKCIQFFEYEMSSFSPDP